MSDLQERDKANGEKKEYDFVVDWVWDKGDWFLPERWIRENQ